MHNTTAAGQESQRQRARQDNISKSVLEAVGLHFLFTTVPFVVFVAITLDGRSFMVTVAGLP